MGIPLEEASLFAAERLVRGELDAVSLHLAAHDALTKGLAVLKQIADEGPRYGSSSKEGGTTVVNSDLIAAQSLVRFALDAKKLLKTSVGKPEQRLGRGVSVQLDLWDNMGCWELKDQSK